jgi:hypothetical protein
MCHAVVSDVCQPEVRYVRCADLGSGVPNQALSAADKIPFTLGQLVVFRTMALSGSGAAAALTLSVSQPAISKSLALLEQVSGLLQCSALVMHMRKDLCQICTGRSFGIQVQGPWTST